MGAEDKIVEGEWNGFIFRIVREEDFEIVHEHLSNNFFQDEPLSHLLGYSQAYADNFVPLWKPTIPQKLSILAIDKATNKVAGCRVTFEHRKGHEYPDPVVENENFSKLYQILCQVASKVNVYDEFNVDRYAEFLFVSVDREFRGRGLALELYERSIALIKARGYPAVKCIFTSPYSRRNGEKVGFQDVLRMNFGDFTDDNGEPLLPKAEAEQIVTLGVLRF